MSAALSPREWQVVELISTGQSNKQIAHEFSLTEGTIKVYVARMMQKLHMRNRVELAVWYVQLKGER